MIKYDYDIVPNKLGLTIKNELNWYIDLNSIPRLHTTTVSVRGDAVLNFKKFRDDVDLESRFRLGFSFSVFPNINLIDRGLTGDFIRPTFSYS